MIVTEEQKKQIIEEQNEWNHYCDKTLEIRREGDMFFTPPHLIFDMIEQIDDNVDKENYKVLDPTCGSGNLLAALAICGYNPKNLYGNEYDKDLVELARTRLEKLGVPKTNIHQGDALDVRYIQPKSFNPDKLKADVVEYEKEELW